MSEIDDVLQQIGGYFNHLSGENYIRVLDTPHAWGLPFGTQIMDQARVRQGEFARALSEVVQKAKYRCDLASLNSPDPDWIRVVVGAMDTCLSTPMGRTQPTQFRFLFGQTPTVPVGEPANFTELKAALVRLVRDRSAQWERMPEIWVGRFYQLAGGIMTAIQAKVFGSAVIGSDDTKMTWNHSKIIVVDGVEALAGGHNLNMDLFRTYPPVHDASVVMHGDGAFGSELFLNQMWACGTNFLTKEYLNGQSWNNGDSDRSRPIDPMAAPAAQDQMRQRQAALLAMHRSGKQTGQDTPVPPLPPQPSGIRDNDLQTLTEIHEPAFPERVTYGLYDGFDEYKLATRVLSLGKYWNESGFQGASEVMKKQLILNAKRVIRMSQMDLVSAWKKNWSDHVVCQWTLQALLANPNLTVQVVVSPLDAGAGAEGDQYSFGSGAVRTYALMEYYMTHDVATDQLLPDPEGKRRAALQRLQIAPMYYTDKVPADKTIEGDTYKWPNLTPEGYTATLKQPPLSEQPPREGVIGSAAWAVINASGYIYKKVPSAPGNHAKIMIVDDEAYVIGSDNLYPGFLSEFDYLVEGKDAVNELLASYWEPLWRYSGPHSINGAMTTILRLFYRGTDNNVWSRWRNPDGSWSGEQHIGGVLNGDPISAVVPGTTILQLFYRGTDNNVWSRWRNPDGSWSAEQHIGGVLNGDPIAAVVPGTDILQLFYRGTDDNVWSRWRNPNGSWSAEQKIGGVLNGDPIAAVVPGTDILQLFYRGTDNNVWSRWRNPDGSWSGEQKIGGVLNGDPIAAVVPGTDILQLFYRGTDNNVWSRWRNPDGSWSGEQKIGGVLNGDPIAAVVPGTDILQLFYRGKDNNVWSRWRNPDGSWSDEQKIGGVLNGDPIAAVVPGTTILQLFYRGTDNNVWSRWRNPDGGWSAEQHIGGVLNGDPIVADVTT